MVISLPYYDPKVTEESYSELKAFIDLANRRMGYFPIIIGGWAVYSYTHDQKSQDIDAVMPDEESYYKFIHHDFFETRGYREFNVGGDDQHFGKEITDSNGKPTTIRFDVMFSNKPHLIKALNIVKDWSLIFDNRQVNNINGGKIYVPTEELLITLKMIGALERLHDMRYTSYELVPLFQSKIKKDYWDIASLIKTKKPDKKNLHKFYKKTRTDKHVNNFILKYKDNNYGDIFTTIKMNFADVEEALVV